MFEHLKRDVASCVCVRITLQNICDLVDSDRHSLWEKHNCRSPYFTAKPYISRISNVQIDIISLFKSMITIFTLLLTGTFCTGLLDELDPPFEPRFNSSCDSLPEAEICEDDCTELYKGCVSACTDEGNDSDILQYNR